MPFYYKNSPHTLCPTIHRPVLNPVSHTTKIHSYTLYLCTLGIVCFGIGNGLFLICFGFSWHTGNRWGFPCIQSKNIVYEEVLLTNYFFQRMIFLKLLLYTRTTSYQSCSLQEQPPTQKKIFCYKNNLLSKKQKLLQGHPQNKKIICCEKFLLHNHKYQKIISLWGWPCNEIIFFGTRLFL